MATLEQLLEQTSFLLDKQKEAKEDCLKIFADLMSSVEKKLEQVKDQKDEFATLERVYDLVASHAQKMADDADGDIEILNDQLMVLQQIKGIKDPERVKELLAMVLPEDEEMQDTEVFKKEITHEAALAKQNLLIAAHDIKEAINEGSSKDVQIMLEAMLEADEDEDCDQDDDEEEDDDHESSEKGGGCGGCKGCGPAGGCGKGCSTDDHEDGMDLFEQLARYAEEQDQRKKN